MLCYFLALYLRDITHSLQGKEVPNECEIAWILEKKTNFFVTEYISQMEGPCDECFLLQKFSCQCPA